MSVPFDRAVVARVAAAQRFDVRHGSIREMSRFVDDLERELGTHFVRMEFGIPGLPLDPLAIAAEAEALGARGRGHVYAPFDGIPELKAEAARFVQLFLDVDVTPACCIPTVGSMQGCFVALALAGQLRAERRTVVLLEPGFPVNRLQLRLLGLRAEPLDFYDHRGPRLLEAVERLAARGDVCALLWSSPNNPSWICLQPAELEGLARIAERYELIAIEDLAYFGMDTRQDYYQPGRPPFQPSVLQHGSRAISLISTSKLFSYAGQRIGLAVIAPALMDAQAPALVERFGTANIGHAFVHGGLYPLTACVPQSSQHGLLALLRAANGGERRLFGAAAEYARRARIVKRLFLDHGFRLVYDNDLGAPLADGFYFTVAHPAYAHGADLLAELLHYGISAITLETAGSIRVEGLRACVSQTGDAEFPLLEERLGRFSRGT
ncbi:MAG TPA: pyridoxal phosphate-dependent aminotransferase [Candidatus Polarisedimenticolaceae bacterium]|nr:pyridoxal phosphate-dependent aminotransferase [Candidatus Polarisedimenticolaceae bacterium]